MPLSRSVAVDLVNTYFPQWEKNRTDLSRVDRWYRGRLKPSEKPWIPRNPSAEYRELRDRSMTRWLQLVVTAVAQSLYVEGYRRADAEDNATAWRAWQANRMDWRQVAVHRGAVSLGLAYVTVLPGELNDEAMPVIRGVSAKNMIALYADPANDEWPLYAVSGETMTKTSGEKVIRLTLLDDEAVYTIDRDGDKLEYVTSEEHGVGVCPVVRFANMLDLDGRSEGEVEPYIDMAARIDQDTFDRLVVQRFAAWLLRWIAGMELADPDKDPTADEKNRAMKAKIAVEDLLVFESPDTKAGAFPATPLDGFIAARDADIRDLAAVTQTPPHHLLGHVANLSAEALAAAEAGLTRKVNERKHSFGESWEQVLRTAAFLLGDEEGAEDFEAQVRWADTESRSLAQAADAIVKLAQAGGPLELLAEKYLPDWTQADQERLRQLLEDGDAFAQLLGQLQGAAEPVPVG